MGNSLSSADLDDIRIVAIAASAGGIEALGNLLQELPVDFPVPIVVVLHLSPLYESGLDTVIQSRSTLRVKWATDGERLNAGTVYLAPPNQHLTVTADCTLSLQYSERVNWVRPAADILFASVARTYGKKALAIVLTGYLHDGAAGARLVKNSGGWVLAQDRASCLCFDMPSSAIKTGAVDFVLPLDMLSTAITCLTMAVGATRLFKVQSRLPKALPETSHSANM